MIGFYILIGVISLVSWLISNTLKKKFEKYSKVSLRNGLSGAEIAEKMLADHGIRDVKVILTAPEGINLVVVKIETSEPGLYGLGCATFTQRYLMVKVAIEDYLRDFLIGKNVANIEDIWQTSMVNSVVRGDFRVDPSLKAEFFELVKQQESMLST